MSDLLPSEPDQDWLIDRMAALLGRCGHEPFLCAPLLTPNDRCFPDRWSPDAHGARTLIKRLFAHALLSPLDVAVALYVPETRIDPFAHLSGDVMRRHQGAAAWYAGSHEGIARFAIDARQLTDPVGIVGILCHEVAHAWRDHQGIVEEDRVDEEPLTDLTTIYLGFGILSANASYRFYKSGRQAGILSYTEWSHHRTGYVPVQGMCFLLAAQALICEIPAKTVAGWLGTTQRASFLQAYEQLDPDALIERLRLPEPSAWPPVRALVVDPVE